MKKNFNGAHINQSATIVEKAGAVIGDVRNLIMKYDDDGNVVPATAGTDLPVGIAIIEAGYNDITGETSGKAAVGDDIDIQIKDIGFVIASAEIKKGKEVAAAADGKAAVAASGDYVLGIALNTVAAGGYSMVQITKYQKA